MSEIAIGYETKPDPVTLPEAGPTPDRHLELVEIDPRVQAMGMLEQEQSYALAEAERAIESAGIDIVTFNNALKDARREYAQAKASKESAEEGFSSARERLKALFVELDQIDDEFETSIPSEEKIEVLAAETGENVAFCTRLLLSNGWAESEEDAHQQIGSLEPIPTQAELQAEVERLQEAYEQFDAETKSRVKTAHEARIGRLMSRSASIYGRSVDVTGFNDSLRRIKEIKDEYESSLESKQSLDAREAEIHDEIFRLTGVDIRETKKLGAEDDEDTPIKQAHSPNQEPTVTSLRVTLPPGVVIGER